MKIDVKVHPRSKRVKLVFASILDVYLTEPPENGLANRQLIKVLQKVFGCDVSIAHGFKSKRKIVLLDVNEREFSEIKKEICRGQGH